MGSCLHHSKRHLDRCSIATGIRNRIAYGVFSRCLQIHRRIVNGKRQIIAAVVRILHRLFVSDGIPDLDQNARHHRNDRCCRIHDLDLDLQIISLILDRDLVNCPTTCKLLGCQPLLDRQLLPVIARKELLRFKRSHACLHLYHRQDIQSVLLDQRLCLIATLRLLTLCVLCRHCIFLSASVLLLIGTACT